MTSEGSSGASYVSERDLYREARSQDPDRALCAMIAPPKRRAELLALVLLGQEFARIPDNAHEPMLAMMRLQWWRGMIAGEGGSHPLLDILGPAMGDRLQAHDLNGLLGAREAELEWRRPQTLMHLERHVDATAGMLQRITAGLLGVQDPSALERARWAGIGYGLVGVVRSHEYHLERGRNHIPEEFDHDPPGKTAYRAILARAQHIIRDVRRGPRPRRETIAALLPVTFADAQARNLLLRGSMPAQAASPGISVLRLMIAYWRRRP